MHINASASVNPDAVGELSERAQLATDLAFNGGNQFANGEWVMVDLVPVDNPADADMQVQVDDTGQPGTTHPNSDVKALTSQLRDQLGLAPSTADALSPSDLQQLSSEIDRATLAPRSLPPWLTSDSSQSSSTHDAPATDYRSSPDSDSASVAGHDSSDHSLPATDYFRPDGRPVPTDELVHPEMDETELQRLQALDSQLSAIARDHRSRTGAFPDPPPGVGRGNPAVDALLPNGWDPFHGVGRDAWMRSIAGPNGDPAWADGNLYPQGFSSSTDRHPAMLQPGEVIDRFGGPSGRFTSPAGVPYPQRALPPTNLDGESYHQYEVLRPLPMWRGGIAPQMGEPGLGSQHYLPVSVQALIDAGYLREVDPLPHAPASGADVDAPTADGLEERGNPAASPTTYPFTDARPGFSIMSATDRFYQDVQSVSPLAGHYDVVAHGQPNSVNMDSTGGGAMSARELANLIRHRPDYVPGTPIRLLSCNTGRLDGNFARSLAQALGTPVVAPDGYLYTSRGRLGVDARLRSISPWQVPRLPDTCHRFHPDGRVEELDRSEWEG
ncbi:glycohydrolase toxin TNT-related protein [Nocardia sp. NPDC058480]|uniref:glycohydrolase toxin TNT-related protein n=1 Tax=Nocardia sp. NPDC058480 TaxID=3346522 RepID=UPI0036548350